MSNELKVKFVLDLSEAPASAQKALDIFNSKFSNNTASMSNAQMDRLIDQSGILSAGEKAGNNFSNGFKGKMKGHFNTKDIWKSILPSMPDFLQDPGFFTRGKSGNTLDPFKGLKEPGGKELNKVLGMGDFGKNLLAPFKGLRDVTGKDLAKVIGLGDFNTNVSKKIESINMKEVLTGAIATMFNPFVGSMMLSNSMKGKEGGGVLSVMGQMSYGQMFVAVKAVSLAFSGLQKIVMLTTDAYENARKAYAKSLQSGLGLQFTTQRGMVASIMGVSETEVVKFGWAMNYLSNRTQTASKIIADTSPRLALVSWEFNILKNDLSALFAKIADEAQPAIMILVHGLDMLVNTILKNAKLFHSIMAAMGMPGALNNFIQDFGPAKTSGGSKLTLPNPQSFMKQLPASAWEHMGLAIGGGGSTTNDLIRKSNSYLKTIASVVVSGQPRGQQFGMSPATNNP